MRRGLEHAHAGQRQAERRLRREPRHREPLGRHGDAVLAAGVAHVARAHARRPRQLPGHLLGGAHALLDAHEGVLALARRPVERDLVDPEVLGRGAQAHGIQSSAATGPNERRCTGEGPSRRSAAR